MRIQNAFFGFTDESIIAEEAEYNTKVLSVFSVVAAEDKEIIDINHNERGLTENRVH